MRRSSSSFLYRRLVVAAAVLSALVVESAFGADLPPLGRNVPKLASETESKIAYSWKSGTRLVYKFEVEVDIARETYEFSGRNSLTPTNRKPSIAAPGLAEQRGSGSGFVVHPEGIIVTCAHVVRGATKLSAKIGDRDYDATLIGADYDQDIAVLRVRGKDLPHVTFADSDNVRLADEVRALGFPLTEVLGKSIKVIRGEVSGIGGANNSTALQIDASLNPGNSGGPIIDSSGRVVGVASSLLSGARLSEVGFAIPANVAVSFVESLHVPVALSDETNPQSPADIVAQVSPACVLIEATYGANGIGTEHLSELEYSAYWYNSTIPKPGARSYGYAVPNDGRGAIVLNRSGDILDGGDKPMLPCLLEGSGSIGIEKLPTSAPGTTRTTSPLVLQRIDKARQQDRFSPYSWRPSYRSRLGRPWLGDPKPRTNAQLLSGLESVEYSFGVPEGDLIELTKVYELHIDGASKGDEPYLKMTGKGTGKFDQAIGLMQSMDYQAELVLTEDNVSVRIPVRLKYERMTEEQLEEERKRAEQRKKEREKLAAEQKQAEQDGSSFSSPTPVQDSDNQPHTSVKSIPASRKLNKFNFDK